MNRKALPVVLATVLVALWLAPIAAHAVSPWLIGSCLTQANGGTFGSCSIETNYRDVNNVVQNLCSDGIDNDGNGLIDAADPHCTSEVLCQDGFDNDGDLAIDEAELLNGSGSNAGLTDCSCVRRAARLPGGTACTAEDMTVSYSAQPIVSDGCMNRQDTLVAQLFATITVKPERYDLAMWINLDGTNGLDGALCSRQVLTPVSSSPDPMNPAGTGPFNNLDVDACGDLAANQSAIYRFPYLANVKCDDLILSPAGVGGFVDLGQCGSWQQPGGNPVCSNISGAVPGTSSKCNCARGDTSVPGPNLLTSCTAFQSPSGLGSNGSLDFGETALYTYSFTNSVPSCTPGAPVSPDVFGRTRCGTASFVRFVIAYGNAYTRGEFYYDGVSGETIVPACSAPAVIPNSPTVNGGVLCNDTANSRLIWAPRDPNTSNAYGVISSHASQQNLPFKYRLRAGAATGTISLVARAWWDNDINTAAPVDSTITPLEAVDLTGAIEQTCADCGCSSSSNSTPVTLSSFRATHEGRGTRFDWSTATEVGNLGFNLYAVIDGEQVLLNDEPIAATSSDSLESKSYSAFLYAPGDADTFMIEDLDLHGKSRAHGPFQAGKKYGAKVETSPIDWGAVRRENGLGKHESARAIGRGRTSLAPAAAPSGGKGGGGGGTGGGGSFAPIELHVDRDGLYRVRYEDLANAGFDLAGQSSAQLALTVNGKPVPMFVSPEAKFGPGSYFEFWGDALNTLYTKTNVYSLTGGEKRAARVVISTTAPSGNAPATYTETRRFERNLAYALTSTTADPFYDTRMVVFSTPGNWPFNFSIDGYVPAGGPAVLKVDVYGDTSYAKVNPDHHIQFLVNGTFVGEAIFDGTSGVNFAGEIPAGALNDGANVLTLRLPADLGAPADVIIVDAYSVTYPRAFDSASGRLLFSAAGSKFDVRGLPSTDVVAYRRDASTLTRLSGLEVTPDAGLFRASLPGSSGTASYAVADSSGLRVPAIVAARPATDITSGSASYVMISHAAFIGGLQPLVAARTAQGHTVKIVNVEDIYSQFRGGAFDAGAIRDYVAHAYRNMGTRHVLLVGGDSYDYHNYLGLAPVSFVPSLYVDSGKIVHFAPSDSSYADVDGDGVQDLAIGRFDVRSLTELDNVVAKTLAYEAKLYTNTAIVAADYPDATANEAFSNAGERLIGKLASGWAADRIYLEELGLTEARTRLFGGIDSGSALTLYIGHSGLTSWGSPSKPVSQHLFTINDVATLTNWGRPTVVMQLGCWNTYYASPRTESLGSRLLRQGDIGAAAVLGAATLTDDANGNRFGALLAPLLAEKGRTIGDAIVQAKKQFAINPPPNADLRDVLVGWTLLGDPAVQVAP